MEIVGHEIQSAQEFSFLAVLFVSYTMFSKNSKVMLKEKWSEKKNAALPNKVMLRQENTDSDGVQ